MTRRRSEILDDILELAADLRRDDPQTLAMLALLRNGHPGSTPPGGDSLPHPDNTGEWAIGRDSAVELGRQYDRHVYHAFKALVAADNIGRQMKPINTATANVPDNDEWCKNCIQYQFCSPRTKDGGQYCNWCRTIRQTWGFLPPQHVVEMWHSGNKATIYVELQKAKKGKR